MIVEEPILRTNSATQPKHSTRICTCPNCHKQSVFTFSGEQHWHPKVAAAKGLPTTVSLWKCSNCHKNITEDKLNKEKSNNSESN